MSRVTFRRRVDIKIAVRRWVHVERFITNLHLGHFDFHSRRVIGEIGETVASNHCDAGDTEGHNRNLVQGLHLFLNHLGANIHFCKPSGSQMLCRGREASDWKTDRKQRHRTCVPRRSRKLTTLQLGRNR